MSFTAPLLVVSWAFQEVVIYYQNICNCINKPNITNFSSCRLFIKFLLNENNIFIKTLNSVLVSKYTIVNIMHLLTENYFDLKVPDAKFMLFSLATLATRLFIKFRGFFAFIYEVNFVFLHSFLFFLSVLMFLKIYLFTWSRPWNIIDFVHPTIILKISIVWIVTATLTGALRTLWSSFLGKILAVNYFRKKSIIKDI